jgi:hypothetical protein
VNDWGGGDFYCLNISVIVFDVLPLLPNDKCNAMSVSLYPPSPSPPLPMFSICSFLLIFHLPLSCLLFLSSLPLGPSLAVFLVCRFLYVSVLIPFCHSFSPIHSLPPLVHSLSPLSCPTFFPLMSHCLPPSHLVFYCFPPRVPLPSSLYSLSSTL